MQFFSKNIPLLAGIGITFFFLGGAFFLYTESSFLFSPEPVHAQDADAEGVGDINDGTISDSPVNFSFSNVVTACNPNGTGQAYISYFDQGCGGGWCNSLRIRKNGTPIWTHPYYGFPKAVWPPEFPVGHTDNDWVTWGYDRALWHSYKENLSYTFEASASYTYSIGKVRPKYVSVDGGQEINGYEFSEEFSGSFGNSSCAQPPPTPIPGLCGLTNNTCTNGNLFDDVDSSTQYIWSCQGLQGGVTASCSEAKPSACVPTQGAACGPANSCGVTNGTIQCDGTCSSSVAPYTTNGSACTSSGNSCGMTNTGSYDCSGVCSATTPAESLCPLFPTTNGSCALTHYGCTAGTSINNIDGLTSYAWSCQGSGGGTTASCSEAKVAIAVDLKARVYSPIVTAWRDTVGNDTSALNPLDISPGQELELEWTSSNNPAVCDGIEFSTGNFINGNTTSVTEPTSLIPNKIYKIICRKAGFTNVEDWVFVRFLDNTVPPTIFADPSTVNKGRTVIVSGNLNGHTGCTVTGARIDGPNDTWNVSGIGAYSQLTGPIQGRTRFTLTCTDWPGQSVYDEVEVRQSFVEE